MLGAYDLVVRDGTIFDGSGADPFVADVAIKDGRIAAVGKIVGRGREEIDAAGHLVTPGFVDVHTHSDGPITQAGMKTARCRSWSMAARDRARCGDRDAGDHISDEGARACPVLALPFGARYASSHIRIEGESVA